MSDLHDLISKKQDELRGRPRNWRDDLSDWSACRDWPDVFFNCCMGFVVLSLLVDAFLRLITL